MTKTIEVTYYYSTKGQKANVLAGGSGKFEQTVQIDVTEGRLELAQIDDDGVCTITIDDDEGCGYWFDTHMSASDIAKFLDERIAALHATAADKSAD